MNLKRTFLYLGAIVFSIGGAMLAKEIYFTFQTESVMGNVVEVKSKNLPCKIDQTEQPCTAFSAKVEYQISGGDYFYTVVSDKEVAGNDQPISQSDMYIGREVEIFYNSSNPSISISKSESTRRALFYLMVTSIGALLYFFSRHKKILS